MKLFTERKPNPNRKEHEWFAWYPVFAFLPDNRLTMVWLEWVRKIPWQHNNGYKIKISTKE